MATTTRRPVAFSLFAGAGGLELGLQQAGFDVAVATDHEQVSEETHRLNFPTRPFLLEDIRRVSGRQLIDLASGRAPQLVAGGPPCQGFSTLGDKLSSDPRNRLFDEFARIVAELSPECVLLENVRALVTMYHGQFAEYVAARFEDLGYRVRWKILDAASYGVPQHRERVFFVATRLDVPFEFPLPTHGSQPDLKPFVTVGETIMDLVGKEWKIPSHIPLRHGETVLARYRLIPEGGKLPPPEKLPPRIRRGNFGNSYKRVHRQRPALTMVPGNNAFALHPTLDRSLTPREAARLQTFPDTFLFAGDRRRQCILVGNAVPPLLAKAVGKALLKHLVTARGVAPRRRSRTGTSAKMRRHRLLPLHRLHEIPERIGFVDLFSGAGGFTLGFGRAGWRPLLSVDNDDVVAATHVHNFPSLPYMRGDLSDPGCAAEIGDMFAGHDVGAVVGGPPCQGFSIFGRRRFVRTGKYDAHADDRNKLVFAFVRVVEQIQPRWVVMENVPGLATLERGAFLSAVLDDLRALGYLNVEARVLNAADYGVPQLRRRLVIIGSRTGHIIPWPKRKFFESPEDWQDPYRTVGQAIADLATIESLSQHTCHVPMNHRPLLVERYKLIPEGGRLDIDALPEELRRGYRSPNVRNYSHIYRRLDRNKPATTMVPGHNAFPVHPWLNRSLTVREAARLQTFPDELEFCGTRQQQCIQVGNAFPPLLAELLANNIRKAEVNGWYPGRVPPLAYYSLLEGGEEAAQPSLSVAAA